CTFVLRHSVGHWLEEARWTRKDLEQIERRAANPGGDGMAPGAGTPS
ncbi:MAG: hypothetical protein HKN17_03010, partial [Rhodothermales bacterium]|nr:hypothetical protein [Rhodothermales bacterium]